MTLKKFRETFQNQLQDLYPHTEVQSFFRLIIAHYLNLNHVDCILKENENIHPKYLKALDIALKKLKKHTPVQHIIGYAFFRNLPMKVDKNALIPRPETAYLVDWILKDFGCQKSLEILDIGTGSGCIAIALKKRLPQAKVRAIDICDKALEVACKNAILNNVEIDFKKINILSVKSLEKYNIIVSNPPYVRESEKINMRQNVLRYEPHKALFVKDTNPLIFYEKISGLALKALKNKGSLYFEINENSGKEVLQMLKNKTFKNISLRKDIFEKDRMVKACL